MFCMYEFSNRRKCCNDNVLYLYEADVIINVFHHQKGRKGNWSGYIFDWKVSGY